MRILVTGGAGFIGSQVVDHILTGTSYEVCNIDKLTYAANSSFFFEKRPRCRSVRADICDKAKMIEVIRDFQPDTIMHLAAETHVDRSIDSPDDFVQTNVIGTVSLLEAAQTYRQELSGSGREAFRFHHVSTDEVYGDLESDDPPFSEMTCYAPSSPYSASKAASDHFVRAWGRTYGLPVVISNCSNNYGPRQMPEKLVPLTILNALSGQELPVYGDGLQVRDWLHVDDHAAALLTIAERGKPHQSYNVGGRSERRNIDVVRAICAILEDEAPEKPAGIDRYEDLITFVKDRPGHDRRYAIDDRKIEAELGWLPQIGFEAGLRSTIRWYLAHRDWCEEMKERGFRGQRLGRGRGTA